MDRDIFAVLMENPIDEKLDRVLLNNKEYPEDSGQNKGFHGGIQWFGTAWGTVVGCGRTFVSAYGKRMLLWENRVPAGNEGLCFVAGGDGTGENQEGREVLRNEDYYIGRY